MSTPDDETWTTGQAAVYLNAGGVDFGYDARQVRQAADNPDCQIRAVRRGRWRRVLVSTVRAERARLLAEADRVDPEAPAG